MKKFFFWNEWPLAQRILYLIGLLAFAGGLFYYFVSYFKGNDNIISWYKEGELDTVKVFLESFQQYLFEFNIEADNYLLTETFHASLLKLNLDSLPPYLLLQSLGVVFILCAISDVRKLWFFIGASSLMVMWAFMGFEVQGILDDVHPQAYLMLLGASFLVPAFIVQHSLPQMPYMLRFLFYSSLMALHGWVIHTYSEVPEPFLHISNLGITIPLLLTLIFIVITSHEFIRGAVFLTTHEAASAGKDSTKRFGFLAGLYLVNMLYVTLNLIEGVELNIVYLPPIIALAIAALLGVWGFKAREMQYKEIMPFQPTGAFLYLGLGLLAISTVSYVLANANDPMIEVFEDAVIYTHLGFGLGFAVYTYANFIELMRDGQPVYKVLFRPLRLDYFYGMALGILIIVGIMFYHNFFTYNQAFAGYYNGLGDLYQATDDGYTSKQYYRVALGYDPANHRSYYSLGSMAKAAGDDAAAKYFFTEANWKNPSPYAYAHLAEIEWKDKKYFQAIFTLKEGLENCPESGELFNNLALLFNRTDIADSVLVYFELAREYSDFPEVVESNSFALWTKYQAFKNIDSLYGDQKPREYVGTAANELIYLNLIGEPTKKPFQQNFLPDSSLGTPQLCYLFHYALNQRKTEDTTLLKKLESYALRPENADFEDYLLQAKATIILEKGQLKEGTQIFERLGENASSFNPYFNHVAGLWYLRAGLPEKAAPMFRIAARRGHPEGTLNRAIALSEFKNKTEATALWQEIAYSEDAAKQQVAHDMLKILHPDSLTASQAADSLISDIDKYRYLHYYRHSLSEADFDTLLQSIGQIDFRVVALAERLDAQLEMGQNSLATATYSRLQAISENLSPRAALIRAKALLAFKARLGEIDTSFKGLFAEAAFDKTEQGKALFYKARIAEADGHIQAADSLYQHAIEYFPYEPTFFAFSAAFCRELGEKEKAYEQLLAGLEEHPRHPLLLQRYAMLALELYFVDFADIAVNDLKEVMPPAPYQEFLQAYTRKKAEIEKPFEEWNN